MQSFDQSLVFRLAYHLQEGTFILGQARELMHPDYDRSDVAHSLPCIPSSFATNLQDGNCDCSIQFCIKVTRELGPVWMLRALYRNMMILGDHKLARPLMNEVGKSVKNDTWALLQPAFAKGLLFREGQEWQRTRRLLNPSFSVNNVNRVMSKVSDVVDELVDTIGVAAEEGRALDVVPLFQHMTYEVIMRTTFSHKSDALRSGSKISDCIDDMYVVTLSFSLSLSLTSSCPMFSSHVAICICFIAFERLVAAFWFLFVVSIAFSKQRKSRNFRRTFARYMRSLKNSF